MKTIGTLAVVTLVLATVAVGGESKTAVELKALILQNLAACESEDLAAEMETVHTQSPGYLLTKQQASMLFENFDFKYDLTHFKFIGEDEEYAVARIRQKTTKKAGPAFKNNETDLMAVFRREAGVWKFWNQVVLETRFLD